MVGLVDYSSDDEAVAPSPAPAAASLPPPPPLPRAFHDLYAASVRTAPADLPALHQGRTRATPHVDGQWPSHLYAEWFPPPPRHARLTALLDALRDALHGSGSGSGAPSTQQPALHSLLASDLGTPLPLHISLSRPFVLPTAGKADFLAGLVTAIAQSRVKPFAVAFTDLAWHRSPDSARAFLVLRVTAVSPTPTTPNNQPLVALLARCNAQVAAAGQPVLYADGAATAFHMSIAWSLAATADDEKTITGAVWTAATREVFAAWQGETPTTATASHGNHAERNSDWRIPIDSVKAKIGNVVTDIPLGPAGRRQRGWSSSRDHGGSGSVLGL